MQQSRANLSVFMLASWATTMRLVGEGLLGHADSGSFRAHIASDDSQHGGHFIVWIRRNRSVAPFGGLQSGDAPGLLKYDGSASYGVSDEGRCGMKHFRLLATWLLSLVCLAALAFQPAQATGAEPGAPISGLVASPSAFYPLVRDKYLDDVRIKWGPQCDGLNWGYGTPHWSCASFSIADAAGTVVRQGRSPEEECYPADNDAGEICFHSVPAFSWDGRDAAGLAVPAGVYTVTVTADGSSASVPVTVATKTERTYETLSVKRAAERSATKGCYAKPSAGQMTVDCWGGGKASATFWAFIPEGAKVAEKKIVGTRLCCKRGSLTMRYKRTQSDLMEGTVTVTGWRAFAVKHFKVNYSYDRVY